LKTFFIPLQHLFSFFSAGVDVCMAVSKGISQGTVQQDRWIVLFQVFKSRIMYPHTSSKTRKCTHGTSTVSTVLQSAKNGFFKVINNEAFANGL
jgi:hypothetical protein